MPHCDAVVYCDCVEFPRDSACLLYFFAHKPADFIGAVLFPIGPYFPGFTLTAFLTGTVFGVFLHKRQTIPRIVGAVAVNQLVLSLLLQTAWISLLYGSPYEPLLLTRVGQCAILAPLQFVTIGTMTKAMGRYWKRAAA